MELMSASLGKFISISIFPYQKTLLPTPLRQLVFSLKPLISVSASIHLASSTLQAICTYAVCCRANSSSIIPCKYMPPTILPFLSRKEDLARSKPKPRLHALEAHATPYRSEQFPALLYFFGRPIKEVESRVRAYMRQGKPLDNSYTSPFERSR